MASIGLAALAAAVFFWLISATPFADGPDPGEDEAFFDALRIEGASEVEGFDTIDAMARLADLVLLGAFTDFRRGRTLQGDAAEDVVTYGNAVLAITDVVRGEYAGESIEIEFLLTVRPDAVDSFIASQAARLPGGPVVLFLRGKRGGGEAGLYRLVSSTGLWTNAPDGPVIPLVEGNAITSARPDLIDDDELPGAYDTERAQLRSLDDLVALVRAGTVDGDP